MENQTITKELIARFGEYLRGEERAENTVNKYLHDVNRFCCWLNGRELSKGRVLEWKAELCAGGYAAVTVNAALAALHSFLNFTGRSDCRVKYLKLQRKVFRDAGRDLSKSEFGRLVYTAQQQGKERLALVIETICATGMRVSELRCITVESLTRGRAEISMKGKIRSILIPGKLRKKLEKYCKKKKIACGEVFITASGKSLSRRQIWGEMKALCQAARIEARKVFPHNLRHLFARTFYAAGKDIVRLTDVLGHSSVETTRIYLISTGLEYSRELDALGLIS